MLWNRKIKRIGLNISGKAFVVFLLVGGSSVSGEVSASDWIKEYSPDANTALLMHFNEGDGQKVEDFSPNNNHGWLGWTEENVEGGVEPHWVSDGKFNSCLEYSAPLFNEFGLVMVPSSPGLSITGPFSIEAWVCPTVDLGPGNAPLEYMNIISKTDDKFKKGYTLSFGKADGKIGFTFKTATGEAGASTFTTHWKSGTWYHIAGTYDGASTLKLYVNGLLEGMKTVPSPANILNSDDNLKIGTGAGALFGWTGKIDEVKISNIERVFSHTGIPERTKVKDKNTVLLMRFEEKHGDLGLLLDETINQNHGRMKGGADITSHGEGKSGRGLALRSKEAMAEISSSPSLNITEAITIEAWVKLAISVSELSSGWPIIVGKDAVWGEVGRISEPYSLRFNSAANSIYFEAIKDQKYYSISTPKREWKTGTWYHVAFTYDASTEIAQIYIDGALEAIQNLSGIGPLPVNDEKVVIGQGLNGTVDDVRISNCIKYKADFQPESKETKTSLKTEKGIESKPEIVFKEDFEKGLGKWRGEAAGEWIKPAYLSSAAHSGKYGLTGKAKPIGNKWQNINYIVDLENIKESNSQISFWYYLNYTFASSTDRTIEPVATLKIKIKVGSISDGGTVYSSPEFVNRWYYDTPKWTKGVVFLEDISQVVKKGKIEDGLSGDELSFIAVEVLPDSSTETVSDWDFVIDDVTLTNNVVKSKEEGYTPGPRPNLDLSKDKDIIFYDGFEEPTYSFFRKDGIAFSVWTYRTSGSWDNLGTDMPYPPDPSPVNVHSGKYALLGKTSSGEITNNINLNLKEKNSRLGFWYFADEPFENIIISLSSLNTEAKGEGSTREPRPDFELSSLRDVDKDVYSYTIKDVVMNKWQEVSLDIKEKFSKELEEKVFAHLEITAFPNDITNGGTFYLDDVFISGEQNPIIGENREKKPLELEISREHPLIYLGAAEVFQVAAEKGVKGLSLLTLWQNLPEDLRPYSVFEIWGIYIPLLEEAQKNNIPVIWSVMGSGRPGNTSLLEIEHYFKIYPIIKGLRVCELNCGLRTDEKEYLLGLVKLCAAYGKVVLLDDGSSGTNIWLEFLIDPKFYKTISEYKDYFIPIHEWNQVYQMHQDFGYVLGMWLSGWITNFGVNPQSFYWTEAGYGKELDKQSLQWRAGNHLDMPAAVSGQMIWQAVMAGATVIRIGGGDIPNIFDFDGTISNVGKGTIIPTLRMIISEKPIPSKEEVLEKIKVGIQVKGSYDCQWVKGIAHSGDYSLGFAPGSGAATWNSGMEGMIKLERGKKYKYSFWVKSEEADGFCYPVVGICRPTDDIWRYGGWTYIKGPEINGTHDWQKMIFLVNPPPGAAYITGTPLISNGKSKGWVWFDDLELTPLEGGENIIPNPSFEIDTTGRNEPDGWCSVDEYSGSGNFPPTNYTGRTLLTIIKGTYGKRYHGDFIPTTGRYYFIPIFSPFTDKKFLSRFTIVQGDQFATPEEAKVYFDKYYPAIKGEGFVVKIGDVLHATNSYVNSSKTERIDVEFGGLRFVGDLKSQNYIVSKKTDEGVSVLLDNREGWVSEIDVYSPNPISLTDIDGEVKSDWDKDKKRLRIKVEHKVPTAVRFRIGQN